MLKQYAMKLAGLPDDVQTSDIEAAIRAKFPDYVGKIQDVSDTPTMIDVFCRAIEESRKRA